MAAFNNAVEPILIDEMDSLSRKTTLIPIKHLVPSNAQ